jgi:hypothetical protein
MFDLFLQGMFSSLRSCRIRDLIVYEFRRHGRGSVADCGVKLLSYFHVFQSCRGWWVVGNKRTTSPLLIPTARYFNPS